MKNRQTAYHNYVQKITYTLNIHLSTLVGTHSITEDEFTALVNIKQKLIGPFNEDKDLLNFVEESSNLLWNLYEKSNDLIANTSTSYCQMFDLIEKFLSPQPEPKFGMFEMSRAAENANSAALMPSSSVVMPAFPSLINFLNPAVVSSK